MPPPPKPTCCVRPAGTSTVVAMLSFTPSLPDRIRSCRPRGEVTDSSQRRSGAKSDLVLSTRKLTSTSAVGRAGEVGGAMIGSAAEVAPPP